MFLRASGGFWLPYFFNLLLGGFGKDGRGDPHSPSAEEKRYMPGAALAAAKRPQEQGQQEGPLQNAPAMRAQNILASAQRAMPGSETDRNGVRSGHEFGNIAMR